MSPFGVCCERTSCVWCASGGCSVARPALLVVMNGDGVEGMSLVCLCACACVVAAYSGMVVVVLMWMLMLMLMMMMMVVVVAMATATAMVMAMIVCCERPRCLEVFAPRLPAPVRFLALLVVSGLCSF